MHDHPLAEGVAHFNAGRYRDALLAFEARWHAERSDLLRALIQLSNAMNQLRLGLLTGPRRNLASAAALLAPLPERCEGLDVAGLRQAVASVRACIPAGVESGAASLPWETVPVVQLVLMV
ncbi:MAG: DUF309 domain-containing protein [Chloroflexaceae bacterium]|jgi:predicted metal-dependent hydrolase|nr:DUF309 domain-containing protein [Chloroflexaceae bacterium]